jgi:hypothetical protein
MKNFRKSDANPLKNIERPVANPVRRASETLICFSLKEIELGMMK